MKIERQSRDKHGTVGHVPGGLGVIGTTYAGEMKKLQVFLPLDFVIQSAL